jgi:rhodanese-related sulfurtransferase
MTRHRSALAGAALLLGVLAAVVRTPSASTSIDIAALARAVEREDDHVTAVELATWIKDRQAGLRVVDVRSAAEFSNYHVPTAERIGLDALVTTPFAEQETVVLYSDGGAHAAQGWVFLRARGHRQVYFVRGGIADWLVEVMNPSLAADATPEAQASFERVAAISRYFGGRPHRETDDERTARLNSPRPTVAESMARMRKRGC